VATDARLDRPQGRDKRGAIGRPAPASPGRRDAQRWGVAIVVLLLVVGAGWLTGVSGDAAWWLTNTVPPAVSLAALPSVVRGTVTIGAQIAPGARIVSAQVDDRPLSTGLPLLVDTASLPDGAHRLLVSVEDTSLRRNRSQADVEILSDNTPPHLTLASDPPSVSQGDTWLLRVQTDEPATVQVTLDGRPLGLQAADGFGWSVVGIGAEDEPRARSLTVRGVDQAGNETTEQLTVPVTSSQFTQASVQVSAALLPLLAPQVRSDEDAHLAPTYAVVTPERLWSGPFAMPTQGEVITLYGEVRSYNHNPFEGHHAGIDIAAPMSQPVRAPARARVALIDKVRLRGNVVILDHGLGVFTTYAHLSAVNVQVGQMLDAGQPFANVGTTGLSEGPHLHWEVWVRGVNVDPLDWVKRSYP
jgi:murein DD-endopeptidase MepM/ murein hydrolase activator NlpD